MAKTIHCPECGDDHPVDGWSGVRGEPIPTAVCPRFTAPAGWLLVTDANEENPVLVVPPGFPRHEN